MVNRDADTNATREIVLLLETDPCAPIAGANASLPVGKAVPYADDNLCACGSWKRLDSAPIPFQMMIIQQLRSERA